MEYPQDHFTLDALDGKKGGKEDEVVDEDIYYYDEPFLSWFISLHGSVPNHYGGSIHGSMCLLNSNIW